MGLFGSKKIYVSSSVYNLAGNEADRPNFLKSSLFSAVMNPYDVYLGETIVNNYLTGPGIMQRSFFNWAVRNDIAGMPTITTQNAATIDPALVAPFIPIAGTPVGLQTVCQSAELVQGDFSLWAEQYILANMPGDINTEWAADYDETLHEITIYFVGGATVTFPAGTFDKDKEFIAARFYQTLPDEIQPLVVGAITLDVLTPPATTGYSLDSTVNQATEGPYTLNQTVTETKSYDNGDPDIVTVTNPTTSGLTWDPILRTYGKTSYLGGDGNSGETIEEERWMYQTENRQVTIDNVGETTVVVNPNVPGPGVTETVTTNTAGDFLTAVYDWSEDTQDTIIDRIYVAPDLWLYEVGSGTVALDTLVQVSTPPVTPAYYPFIPVRLNNASITGMGALYDESKRAYRKATKQNGFDDLVTEVEANPDIGDIDYSYIQWGVSVNVVDESCKRYMYEFLKLMIAEQNTSPQTMVDHKAAVVAYQAAQVLRSDWVAAQNDDLDPLYGTAQPVVPSLGDPETTTVRLRSDHPSLGGFDNRYTWISIEQQDLVGVGQVGATPGDIWWENGETYSYSVTGGGGIFGFISFFSRPKTLEETILVFQTGDNTYTKLLIWGMVHENYIYGGKSVRTTLKEGVDDPSESVFILPLHAPTVKELGVKHFTQMATANTWITFNSYEVVKKKWYQTFLGMLIIIIAIVVISVLISPAAVGGATGAFGTNATVGAALGFTTGSIAAVVAGAVTNAIAAIIISRAISEVSTEVFGEKWGSIIGAIASFAVNYGFSNGFDSFNMADLLRPEQLLKFTSAIANGYSGMVQSVMGDIQAEMGDNQDEYERATKDIEDLMRSQGLLNDLSFDQMSLTDSVRGNGSSGSYTPELLDEFINRTTMTGGDIVDITLSMVSNYGDLQLSLPRK
jgi:hypothetical protein